MSRPVALVALLVLSAACGGSGRDVGSAAPRTGLTSTSTSTSTTPVPTAVTPGPELDAETARRLHLGSIGPDLATVAAAEGHTGQPVTPFDLTATDTDTPCAALRFSADDLPEGLEVVSNADCTARVSGTVRAGAGSYVVTYRVTDDTGASDVSVSVFEVRA